LFSRYKAELLEDGMFESVSQARSETFSYIEGYYNRVRRHSGLGYKTPEEFERDFNINTQKKGSSSERVCPAKLDHLKMLNAANRIMRGREGDSVAV
jgi:hypothetical protein